MRKILISTSIALSCLMLLNTLNTYACTNLLVTKGATVDGSTMLTYTADANGFMEPIHFHAGGKQDTTVMIRIYEWDSGKFLGEIKQVPETFRVVGNMNEHQLTVGETTFGGRDELKDTNGIMDYGSLIYLALQRAKTAREAIKVITDLVAEYGYYSGGETFSFVDPNEVWMMEMISKGPHEKGAVWVARRIPDGYIAVHANKARITNIIHNDPENCLYSPDVIDFAIRMGYYNPNSGKPFSFEAAYDPATPSSLFACEGRVWSIYRRAAPSQNFSPDYFRAVRGAEPYPLYIKPDNKLSVQDVFNLMRDHFQGTEFDMTKGIAAGPFGNPYRWRPLRWKITGDTTQYAWERPISTQQTAWSFVAQMRSHMPREVGGVLWYGVDDTYTTVYVPLYSNITSPPPAFLNADVARFDFNSAIWIFNLVANKAYNMYSHIVPDIQAEQFRLENSFLLQQEPIENAAMGILRQDRDLAIEFLTNYSHGLTAKMMSSWTTLWENLVMKYNDRLINDVHMNLGRTPVHPGYGDEFLRHVIRERPGYYEMRWREPVKSKRRR